MDRNTIFIKINMAIGHAHTLANFTNLMIARIFYTVDKILSKKLNQKAVKVFCPGTNDYLMRCDFHTSKIP